MTTVTLCDAVAEDALCLSVLAMQVGFAHVTLGAAQVSREAGATVLWLTPWVHNHRALLFYGRRGYQDHGLTHFTFEGESHENRVFARLLALRQ